MSQKGKHRLNSQKKNLHLDYYCTSNCKQFFLHQHISITTFPDHTNSQNSYSWLMKPQTCKSFGRFVLPLNYIFTTKLIDDQRKRCEFETWGQRKNPFTPIHASLIVPACSLTIWGNFFIAELQKTRPMLCNNFIMYVLRILTVFVCETLLLLCRVGPSLFKKWMHFKWSRITIHNVDLKCIHFLKIFGNFGLP